MLEVTNLTKRYGTNTAVSELTFSIDRGQIVGLLGPNGAGKSTTMNMITGYLAPTKGRVNIDGHDMLKEPLAAKRCLGYLPEVPPLYPDLTVKEYLLFVSELKKIKRSERQAAVLELMEKTGTADVRDRLIRNLSKGYRQRVGIASALLGYPELIILDEPTAGLDPGQIIEIRELILSLKNKHTVILSSHILQEISAVCDHILVISHGKLVASGTPAEIEGSIKGENILTLLLQEETSGLDALIRSIPGVTEVLLSPAENGNFKAIVKSDSKTDIRREVFRKMAENDVPVLDMHSESMSLEDVYLRLTEESSNLNAVETTGESSATNAEETAGESSSANAEETVEADPVKEDGSSPASGNLDTEDSRKETEE